MSSIKFDIREYDYASHPWFGEKSLSSRLAKEELGDSFPLFSRKEIHHCSSSEFLDRTQLSSLLQSSNEQLGNPLDEPTIRAIETDGRFVLTGHQPILLTGPLFTFLKAVSVISLSQRLTRLSETPLIPAIWIATEDHDVLEVNRCVINGQTFVCNYSDTIESGKVPQVGSISIQGCRELLLEFLKNMLPDNDFRPWVLDMVASSNFENYGRMFSTLLLQLFKDSKLLFIDPIALRPLFAEILASIVRNWPDYVRAFEIGTKALTRYDFASPLSILNLFEIVEGKRMKCVPLPHGFQVSTGSKDFSSAADEILLRPMDFSPGAGVRPLIQDAALPVMVYVGGQAELLYSWQIDPLYEVAGIIRSKLQPRISATILETKIIRALKRSQLYPDKIFDVTGVLRDYKPDTITLPEAEVIDHLGRRLLDYIETLRTEQNTRWLGKSKSAIQRNLLRLKEKLAEDRKRTVGLGRKDLGKITNAIVPSGKPQERSVNIFQFLGYYGPAFISSALESLDPEKLCHQLVEIIPV